MHPLARAAFGLVTISLAAGCYCCRQDYNPHTGMHYQCRQFGISLFKKECCKKDGPGFEQSGACPTGYCPTCPDDVVYSGGMVEGPYVEGEIPPTYYEGGYMIESAPPQSQPTPVPYQPALKPTPVPSNDGKWQTVPSQAVPQAPPVTQTGYQTRQPVRQQPRTMATPGGYRRTVRLR